MFAPADDLNNAITKGRFKTESRIMKTLVTLKKNNNKSSILFNFSFRCISFHIRLQAKKC